MRILRNLCLMFFPIMIMINLYRFVIGSSMHTDVEFRGLSTFYNYLSTFNGLSRTLDTLNVVSNATTKFSQIEVVDLDTMLEAIGAFFSMVASFFKIPVMLVVDLADDLWWVVNILRV